MTRSSSTCDVRPLQIGPLSIWPPVIQAPMAGFTNLAYRQIVRHWGGAGLLYAEMVSARSFIWMSDRAELPDRLLGIDQEPRPVGAQIWDNDPDALARVGRSLARDHAVSVIDINFGCPAGRVAERARSGSYLLQDPDRVGSIVRRVVGACAPTPVTAKIRLGRDRSEITAIAVAQAVEAAGAAALTVHGRTAADFFQGSADWDQIAELKSHVNRMPVIGNGDLDSAEKVCHAFATYGVDGVMIGRAALGRPWLFRQVEAALVGQPIPPDPTVQQERESLLMHHRLIIDRFGPEKGTMLMRKFACCYAHGRPGARRFRTLAARVRSSAELVDIVERFFPK